MSDPELIVVGRFGAPFGVQGWIHCQSYTTPADNLLLYQPWYYQTQGAAWRPLTDVTIRRHKSAFIAKLASHATREDVAELRGAYIGVTADTLPEPASDEVYWRDLMGCEVVNDDGVLGRVKDVLETGANDVLVVATEAGEVLVPYVEQYVTEVDTANKRIRVVWQPDWE